MKGLSAGRDGPTAITASNLLPILLPYPPTPLLFLGRFCVSGRDVTWEAAPLAHTQTQTEINTQPSNKSTCPVSTKGQSDISLEEPLGAASVWVMMINLNDIT